MADDQESLLNLLQAAQEQKENFTSAATKLVDHCRTEHTSRTEHTTNGSSARNGDNAKKSEDVEMTDAGEAGGTKLATKDASICRSCYSDYITLIHDTYTSPARAQWYTQNPTFLTELNRLLDDAHGLRIPLSDIEKWIDEKRRAWLVSQLRRDVAVKTLYDTVEGGKATFKAAPQSFGADVGETDDFTKLLQSFVSTGKGGSSNKDDDRLAQDAQAAVSKLKEAAHTKSGADQDAATVTASQLGAIYRDVVFPGGAVPDSPAARALAEKLGEGRVGLAQGLRNALREANGGKEDDDADDAEDARAAQVEKHRRRLAELRRAKAAHEAQKRKRLRGAAEDLPYFLQEDAACAACGGAADPQKSPFCAVCFLEVDYCLRENQTVWCSLDDMKKTYAAHFAEQHPCAAGERCARAKPEKSADTNAGADADTTDIPRAPPQYGFCRECVLSFSIATVYCSARCAARDFQRHREAVHLPQRALRVDDRDDRGDLSFKKDSSSGAAADRAAGDYTAVDIARHLLPLGEAFASCQKKHPDWALTETSVRLTLPWPT